MSIQFGFVHYFAGDVRERPDLALGALRSLSCTDNAKRFVVQGMFAGTDRWSRKTRVSDKTLHQLEVDLRGGVYSSVLALCGDRGLETETLTISSEPESPNARYPHSATYTRRADRAEQVRAGEQVALRLWNLLAPGCGAMYVADEPHVLSAELTAIPHNLWGAETNPEDEQRLFLIQDIRHRFGEFARDVAWGNFIGAHLVAALGGLDRIKTQAPAGAILALPHGGALLKLHESPLLLRSEAYDRAARSMRRYMRPILPPELVGL